VRVDFLGVRGSTPAPGAAFVRHGGNTSCVAITADGDPGPTLVLDAGTGLRGLGALLPDGAFRGTILLTHLHWDHTHGLPFSRAVDNDRAVVEMFLPDQGADPEHVLEGMMQPPHFPIRPSEMRGSLTIRSIEEGQHRIGAFTVLAREIPHKGGRTFGYRVSDDHSAIAYLPDHGPVALGPGDDGFGPLHPAALALVDGVDVLLHDGQHSAKEFPSVSTFGHSAVDYAARLAEKAGAHRLVLFHHDPSRTDDAEDDLVAELAGHSAVPVDSAREGESILL
jgi:phosphoribosyl 1,2-cyclic phosphodiesterase